MAVVNGKRRARPFTLDLDSEDVDIMEEARAMFDKTITAMEMRLSARIATLERDRRKLNDEKKEFECECRDQWAKLAAERKKLEDEKAWMAKNVKDPEQTELVELNIGGVEYVTSKQTLLSPFAKGSMLEAMFSGRFQVHRNKKGQIFIDRDGTNFRHVLNFLRTGTIDLSDPEVVEEASFYQLDVPLHSLPPPHKDGAPSVPWSAIAVGPTVLIEQTSNSINLPMSTFSACQLNLEMTEGQYEFTVRIDAVPPTDPIFHQEWVSWIGVYEPGCITSTSASILDELVGERKFGFEKGTVGEVINVLLDLDRSLLIFRRFGAPFERVLPRDFVRPLRFALECGHFTIVQFPVECGYQCLLHPGHNV